MALACLIIGTAEFGDGGVRAAMPFLGQSLIEYQARQAAAAGASHIVILVERVPAAIVGAVDRLKADGIGVDLARSVSDAADRIHPDERLLLIGDGVVARQDVIERMVQGSVPTLLIMPDGNDAARFERIDAGARWAGLALIDGALMRKTAEMLGDWDLQSTLLRRAVQAGATRTDVAPSAIKLADTDEAARKAETIIVAGGQQTSWLPGPARDALTGILLSARLNPLWLRTAAIIFALVSIFFAWKQWFTLSALALAASGPLLSLPRRLDAIALRSERWHSLWRLGRDAAAVAALGVTAWQVSVMAGYWGSYALAASLLGVMVAIRLAERTLAGRLVGPSSLALLFAPFALVEEANAGLGALCVIAFAALIVGLRLIAKRFANNSDPAQNSLAAN